MDLNVGQTLDAVADILEKYGRARMVLEDSAGSVCLVGAVAKVVGLPTTFDTCDNLDGTYEAIGRVEAARYLSDEIARNIPHVRTSASFVSNRLWKFNDTTYDDAVVVDTVRAAAKKWWEEQK